MYITSIERPSIPCQDGKALASTLTAADAVRFWAKVRKAGPDECWLWAASLFGRPTARYGQFVAGGKHLYAHRVAWELANGRPVGGAVVMHSCDVHRCCNPNHLSIGTQADNLRDASQKGRLCLPRKRNREFQQQAIVRYQAGGVTQMQLAVEFGVSHITMCRWLKGHHEPYWRSVGRLKKASVA